MSLHKIDRTTPPSARRAAPLVAADSGLHTKATRVATSSGVVKRFSRDVGRMFWKNSLSTAAAVVFCSSARLRTKLLAPSEAVGPGSTVLTVTLVPAVVSASPAQWRVAPFWSCRNGSFPQDLDRALAGNKNDASPVAAEHPRQIMPAQPDTAQDVHFEEAQPVVISDFLKRFDFKNPQVVYQNLHFGEELDGSLHAVGIAEIGGQRLQLTAHSGIPQLLQRIAHSFFSPPVDDDRGSFLRQCFSDGKADAGGTACNQRTLTFEFEVYGRFDAPALSVDSRRRVRRKNIENAGENLRVWFGRKARR